MCTATTQAHCSSGYLWRIDETHSGHEEIVCSQSTYITGSVSSKIAILMIHDAFGWTLSNSRHLADKFAERVGARVYLPDFLRGQALHPDTLTDPSMAQHFDMAAWRAKCNPQDQMPNVITFAQHLRALHTKTCVVGFCWGGSPALQLGGSEDLLVDCVSVAHPSTVAYEDVDRLKVPIQIIAPETDHLFTPEAKEYCNDKIPTLGIPYAYEWFPGVKHGFATRGDLQDPKQRRAMARATAAMIQWFISSTSDG